MAPCKCSRRGVIFEKKDFLWNESKRLAERPGSLFLVGLHDCLGVVGALCLFEKGGTAASRSTTTYYYYILRNRERGVMVGREWMADVEGGV